MFCFPNEVDIIGDGVFTQLSFITYNKAELFLLLSLVYLRG